MASTWREKLKTGPFQRFYLIARNTKRRLRGEPLAGTIPLTQRPLPVADLLALAELIPDHARLYYSLGLDYLENEDSTSDQKALACLRCAEALGFEATERIMLYKALLMARRGRSEEALGLIQSLDLREMTEEEQKLLSKIARNQIQQRACPETATSSVWETACRQVEGSAESAESLLVIGDSEGVSAHWLPQARYLLIAPEVTGLSVATASSLGLQFEAGIAAEEWQQAARQAGLLCKKWLTIG